ncbi:MAG: ribonuclease HIII [Defluviitaleaceae bacterium]|nr:ribonuclease HIII [Defluviitaleaceae bacterium]
MTLPTNIKHLSAIGSDEVGVGDYLAPLVVTSVYVEAHQIEALHALGVKDSKSMTDKRICEIASHIKEMLPHKTVVFENKYYNAMIDKGLNAHVVKSFLHNKTLSELTRHLPEYPAYLIVDEFASKENHFKYLNQLPKKPDILEKNVYFVKKGESVHIAVAAASILARAAFVTYMKQLSQQLDMDILKGASAKVDTCARNLVKKHGEAFFKDLCKWHFANTKRVLGGH